MSKQPKQEFCHADGAVLSADLERPVTELADKIQTALGSLYNLHTALLNSLGQKTPLPPLLAQFRSCRDTFRATCEQIIAVFQRCHGHADDIMDLCRYLSARPRSECISFATESWNDATNILAEVKGIQTGYKKWYLGISRQQGRVAKALSTTPIINANSRIAKQGEGLSPSSQQFIDIVNASAYPNGPKSLKDSYAVLESISTSLQDVINFWTSHVIFLEAFKSQKKGSQIDVAVASAWNRYKSALQAAMYSISETSDAISVDPAPPVEISSHNLLTIESARVSPVVPTSSGILATKHVANLPQHPTTPASASSSAQHKSLKSLKSLKSVDNHVATHPVSSASSASVRRRDDGLPFRSGDLAPAKFAVPAKPSPPRPTKARATNSARHNPSQPPPSHPAGQPMNQAPPPPRTILGRMLQFLRLNFGRKQ